jgi:excisionase family DNA binding protein
MGSTIGLKPSEIATAFDSEDVRRRFPPILSVPQVAELLGGLSKKTVYMWIAKHRLDGCFRRRGKHVLFWRDRVLDRIFNGPQWN